MIDIVKIPRCEELRPIKVTWIFGEGMPAEAEVCLAPGDGDIAAAIALAVRHLAPETSGDR